MKKKIHTISIMVSAGCGNLGDEYILRSEYEYLRSRFPQSHINIFTYNTHDTNGKYSTDTVRCLSYFPNNIRLYPFRNVIFFLKQFFAIVKSDLLIIGGGGIFYDNEGNDFDTLLRPWKLRMWIARIFRVPTFIWSISLELGENENLRKVFSLLRGVQKISVRDERSREKLKSAGIIAHFIPDPVFLITPVIPSIQRETKRLGVSLRGGFVDNERTILNALYNFLKEQGYDIVFLSHSFHPDATKNDVHFVENIFGKNVFITRSIEETMAQYSQVDRMITMRLHSGILSAVHAIPFLMIGYGPKTAAFMQLLDSPYFIEAQSFRLKNFEERFLALEQEENTIKLALREKCDIIRTDIQQSLGNFFHGLE